jgi:hypothetical protein
MTFQDLYLGQRVRILSWDELNSIGHYDFIGGIHLPDDTFFSDKMKYLCGATLTIVKEPSYSDSDEDYLSHDIFQFDDLLLSFSRSYGTAFPTIRRWSLSPAMLAPLNESSSVIPPAISFDQLLTGGELPQ